MNNTDLVKFVKKALAENWGYCLGTFGQVLTPNLLNQKMKQGGGVGTYNTRRQAYMRKFVNKRVTDCYGLVKGFIWWNNGNVRYNASQDRNQEMAYRSATKKGIISTMPEIPGLVLYMKGHAGVYIGNGEFIECVGAPVGMRKGRISGGRVVSGSRFTHWCQDTYINYGSASTPSQSVSYVRKGHRGTQVATLQKDLNKLGYKLSIDSSFGPATDKAVRDFQRKYGLVVDGSAGPATQAKLKSVLANPTTLKIDLLGQNLVVPGVVKNGTSYIKVKNSEIPVRDIFESMGLIVGWNQQTSTVTVRR